MSGQTITTNIDSNPFDKPSDEILSKLPQENRNKIIELSSRAKVERDKAIRLLKEDAARSKEISAEDLKERQKIMDKTRIKKPMHELYTNIDYSKKTKVSGMGGRGGPIEAIKGRQK